MKSSLEGMNTLSTQEKIARLKEKYKKKNPNIDDNSSPSKNNQIIPIHSYEKQNNETLLNNNHIIEMIENNTKMLGNESYSNKNKKEEIQFQFQFQIQNQNQNSPQPKLHVIKAEDADNISLDMHDQVNIEKSLAEKPIYKKNKKNKDSEITKTRANFNSNVNEIIMNENNSILADDSIQNNSKNSKGIDIEGENSSNKNKYEFQKRDDDNYNYNYNYNNDKNVSEEEKKLKEIGINTANEIPSSKFVNPIIERMINEMKIFLNELTNPETSPDRKKLMLMNPIPKKVGPLFFTVRRYKATFGKRRNPQYELCVSGSYHFVMNAKKRSWNKSPNYLFTIENKKLTIKEPGYFGKLRSNFLGTEFNIYDKGLKFSETKDETQMRIQHGLILYESNLFGTRGPRKISYYIPKVTEDESRILIRPTSDENTIISKVKVGNLKELLKFINKPPKWDSAKDSYVLNFNGRVTEASVKNFQLIESLIHNEIIMQFGKVGPNLFNLDTMHPFSIFQSFALAVSSLDDKYACE